MTKRKCIICRENDAEVPDSNQFGRPIKKVCRSCHAKRMVGEYVAAKIRHPNKAELAWVNKRVKELGLE